MQKWAQVAEESGSRVWARPRAACHLTTKRQHPPRGAHRRVDSERPGVCVLGVLFERGEGVPKDLRQAVVWYSKAAEQGVPGAQ